VVRNTVEKTMTQLTSDALSPQIHKTPRSYFVPRLTLASLTWWR
jgi:hypothetical protein